MDDVPPAEPPTTELRPATDAAAESPAPEAPSHRAATGRSRPRWVVGPSRRAVESDAQFDGNPFPDLVVDDVGRDGEANIANILPSDRPVLLWTWAPH